MSASALLWNIYHIENCKQSIPPKDKFVIIICRYPEIMGFFINSEINGFKHRKKELEDLQIKIDVKNHEYLVVDRWVDCSDLKKGFLESELNNPKGKVNKDIRNKIEIAITNSKRIEGRDKKAILGITHKVSL